MVAGDVFELRGGHPILDLANTIGFRGDPEKATDRLVDFAATVEWAAVAGVIDDATARLLLAADPAAAGQAHRQIVRLRDRSYPVLVAAAQRRSPDRQALVRLHHDVARAMRRAEPSADLPLRSTIIVERPADLADLLTLQAGELLRSSDLDRLGLCADTVCGWLFLDTTRSRTRRWCSSADCGNKERARRHYSRTHR